MRGRGNFDLPGFGQFAIAWNDAANQFTNQVEQLFSIFVD